MSKSNRSGTLENLGNTFSDISCPAPSDILVVTLSGNVIPCSDDFFGKNIMGNICNQSLVDIWNSPKYTDFRKDLLSGKRYKYDACKKCNTIWHSNNPFNQVGEKQLLVS
jgi:radical SAM protein with 4Fe4S-binding SPASM domain